MRQILILGFVLAIGGEILAHDPNATPIAWNREVSRIVYERCASCHRDGGTSFSLMTFQEAQPRAAAIKDAVLSRSMPPWGAVKGFGNFRNDEGLTQDQIELMTDWAEGGTTRGNNPNALPPVPKFTQPPRFRIPSNAIMIGGEVTLARPLTLDGLYPTHVPDGVSMQIVATLPNGDVEPLLWLYQFKNSYRHPFLLRKPLELPSGTVIRGVRPDASILLLPTAKKATK